MKIISKILISTIIIFASLFIETLSAQKLEDVVSLKNGSIIRGNILEVTSQTIQIQIYGGSILVYKTEEIEKTWKEFPFHNKSNLILHTKGYFNLTKIGLIPGNPTGASFITINGYQVNPYLLSGIGIGIEKFDFESYPIFGNIQYNFMNERFSPFISFYGGYSFVKRNDGDIKRYGGILFGSEVGFKSYFNDNFAFYMGIGYRYQALSTKQTQQWSPTTDIINEITYKRLAVSIGLLFN
jgi:hypothetical protein